MEEFWHSKSKLESMAARVFKACFVRKTTWEVPPLGTIKINIDGSFREATGEAGIGMVCRKIGGSFVRGLAKAIEASSPFMAECLALREALMRRSIFANSKIIVETDRECLFKLLRNESSVGGEWQCWDILEEIIGLLVSMEGVCL